MKRDFRAQRAQRDAEARSHAQRQKDHRTALHRHFHAVYKHDMADPIGYSPIWETSSPNRHGSLNSTDGWDPTKLPGSGD